MPQRYRFSVSSAATLARVRTTLDPPSFYDDREGYQEGFLGKDANDKDVVVPVPRLGHGQAASRVKGGGTVLKYHHFSTQQSKSRRLPFWSACNLDGAKRRKVGRSDVWHYDPRIPTAEQIIEECYGNAKDDLFSRGHMTRREDPVWGGVATVAEEDTFTATNAVPQMQRHNAPIWLGLEDYVLRNAAKDKQSVCVFTGPVLADNDPVVHGVKIPVQFWKIVAFLHDDTGLLAATAYLSSQAEFLPSVQPTFVWGQFKDMQVTVKRIQDLTRLGFGPLLEADILAEADASFAFHVKAFKDLLLR
jgi:endonuclease G